MMPALPTMINDPHSREVTRLASMFTSDSRDRLQAVSLAVTAFPLYDPKAHKGMSRPAIFRELAPAEFARTVNVGLAGKVLDFLIAEGS